MNVALAQATIATIHQLYPDTTHYFGTEWQAKAACRGTDTEAFYHPENERGSTKMRRVTAAKRICAQCPVVANCLKQALSVREPFGVWGGTTAEERDEMLAARSA